MRHKWLLILALALLPTIAGAQAPLALHWERYDNLVTIQPDGSMRVAEQQTLVIDQGQLSYMMREFATGEFGRVTNIRVLEDGQPYRRSGDESPGTYSGFDDGAYATIQIFFRDPGATQHTITIEYLVHDALIADGDRVTLDWNFFWDTPDAPEIRQGSVEVHLPATMDPATLDLSASGVPVTQRVAGNTIRWELTGPIQGRQLRAVATFPREILASDAVLNGGDTAAQPAPAQPAPFQPAPDATVPDQLQPDGAVLGGIALVFFCFIVLFILLVAIVIIRASARARRWGGGWGGWGGPSVGPSPWGMPQPPRRRGGFFPPIIIAPPRPPRGSSSRPRNIDPNAGRSGGSSSGWGRSGGSSSGWGKSSGRSTSWGRSGGSSSGWGGLGGGSRGGRSSGGGRRGGRGGGGFG